MERFERFSAEDFGPRVLLGLAIEVRCIYGWIYVLQNLVSSIRELLIHVCNKDKHVR